jgi:hypothetical protein
MKESIKLKCVIRLVVLISAITFNSCNYETITPNSKLIDHTGTPCSIDTVYFQNQVLPLLNSTCAMSDCHNAQFHTVAIDISSYEKLIKLVVPFNPASSILYTVITNSEPSDKMPIYPSPIWNNEQVNMLKKWIEQGALDNNCNGNFGTCDTTNLSYTNFIQPLIAQYCQGCHIQSDWGGGVILNSYDDVKAVALSGRLYGAVAQLKGYSPMPKFIKKLPECYIIKIRAWINEGMVK